MPRCRRAAPGSQSRGDGQTEETVGDGAAEGVADLRRMVDVERIEISRETCEVHDVRFRHCPSWTFPFVADDEIIE